MNVNDKYVDELPDEYKRAFIQYKRGVFKTEHYGSHQPLLIHLLNTITDGNVIEFGIGNNSTPLLHLLCEKLKRKLFSYEFECDWYDKFKSYENENHKLFLLDDKTFKTNKTPFNEKLYSIAFIDSRPAWTRQHAINLLKNHVDYFVVHDVAKVMENGEIIPMNTKLYDFSCFKTVLMFKEVDRATALCTNKEIPEELKNILK